MDVGTKVCSNGPGHMTKMVARPYMVESFLKSPEPKGRLPRDLVCKGCKESYFRISAVNWNM